MKKLLFSLMACTGLFTAVHAQSDLVAVANTEDFAYTSKSDVGFQVWLARNDGNVNKLNWVTNSETPMDKFIVEKSANAKDWVYLGEVRPAGTNKISYDFTDEDPFIGQNYYRLRSVKDNLSNYSKSISVNVNNVNVNGFLGVYPNPVRDMDMASIDIQSSENHTSKLSLINIMGKVMYEQPALLFKGINHIYIPLNNLTAGNYIVIYADSEGKTHQYKLIRE